MADTQAQRFEGTHGEAINIVLTGEDNTNPTGYTLAFTVKAYPGASANILQLTSGMTVAGSGPYTITIPLTRAHTGTTITQHETYWDLWRTDSGSEKCLAAGVLTLKTPVRSQS